MSEFTSGNLILAKNRNLVEEYRVEGMKISDLNSKWMVLLTEDVYIESEVPKYIIDISERTPIMYFFNYEDHGWGYRIFHNGEEVSKLTIDYELGYTMVLEKAEEKYTEEDDIINFLHSSDIGREVYNEIVQEVINSSEYYSVVEKQFSHKNVENFKLFDIDGEDINKLIDLLTIDNYSKIDQLLELVNVFKKIVHINEMEWINYDCIDNLIN